MAMTEADFARVLIEQGGNAKVDPKIRVVMNRLMMQIGMTPSLQAYTVDAGIVPSEDGTVSIQFEFLRLPEEVLPQVEKLLSANFFKDFRWTRYIKNGQARMGLELKVQADSLPGNAYDYAY